nr:response regulator [uncultured Methanoregula sp.]
MQTVLVVDDSSFITEGLASILKKNYRTIISSGGEMCLEILKKETPDIIILDILMEPMDGWETLLHIRENPAIRHIPVIMFSAKKISPFEAETHHPYIDEYITKPVNPRNLLDTIAKVLSRKEAARKTLQLWRQAGLPAEEIEEYARLLTSIEVDRGLCSNMLQQLATGRKDAPAEDIRRSVEIIESRIQKSSLQAEEIAHNGELLVAARGSESRIPDNSDDADILPVEPGQDGHQPVPAITVNGAGETEPAIIRVSPPAFPIPQPGDISSDVGDPVDGRVRGDSDKTESGSAFSLERTSTSQNQKRDATEDRDTALLPGSGIDVTTTPTDIPAQCNPMLTRISESLFEEEPDPEPAKNPDISLQHEEKTPVPAQKPEDREPVQTPPVPAKVPVRQTPKPDCSGRPAAQKTRDIPKNKDTGKSPVPKEASPTPGIFARIIQAILSMFSPRKP